MKKATGIVRKVDELGRVVIPVELRRNMGINEGTGLEIFVNDNGEIVFKKYNPACKICGQVKESYVISQGDLKVCEDCCKASLEKLQTEVVKCDLS